MNYYPVTTIQYTHEFQDIIFIRNFSAMIQLFELFIFMFLCFIDSPFYLSKLTHWTNSILVKMFIIY